MSNGCLLHVTAFARQCALHRSSLGVFEYHSRECTQFQLVWRRLSAYCCRLYNVYGTLAILRQYQPLGCPHEEKRDTMILPRIIRVCKISHTRWVPRLRQRHTARYSYSAALSELFRSISRLCSPRLSPFHPLFSEYHTDLYDPSHTRLVLCVCSSRQTVH